MSDQASPTMNDVFELLDHSLYDDAFIVLKQISRETPSDLNVQSYLNFIETILFHQYLTQFRNLQAVPMINPKYSDRLTQLQLEGNEGYLLTQIDGKTSIKSLIFIAGMGKFRTLQILNKFVQNDIIKV